MTSGRWRGQVGAVLVLGLLAAGGCKSLYYSTWEKLGYQKRDLLLERVQDARASEVKAKDQFKSALDRFRAVAYVNDPALKELEARYDRLKGELDRCEARAADVSQRIAAVKEVSEDLFTEWEKELSQYSNPQLKRQSQDQLIDTRRRYQQLVGAMEKAEAKMQPVLALFRDQVLFLKHNLNAQAVATLQTVGAGLEADTARLIDDMEKSIAEADAFIKEMGKN